MLRQGPLTAKAMSGLVPLGGLECTYMTFLLASGVCVTADLFFSFLLFAKSWLSSQIQAPCFSFMDFSYGAGHIITSISVSLLQFSLLPLAFILLKPCSNLIIFIFIARTMNSFMTRQASLYLREYSLLFKPSLLGQPAQPSLSLRPFNF